MRTKITPFLSLPWPRLGTVPLQPEAPLWLVEKRTQYLLTQPGITITRDEGSGQRLLSTVAIKPYLSCRSIRWIEDPS
jgi:hypothetical protein